MATRPGIVFILIDDMGWRDLACTGSRFYESPNIDRLFAEGMSFTDAYATCPVCSPTRASILTGKYPAKVGITEWIGGDYHGKLLSVPYLHQLPQSERSLAHALRDEGYRTWHVGKWHLGGPGFYPEDHGFDVNIGGYEKGHPQAGYFSPYRNPKLPDGPPGEHLTDRLTDEAIKLIRGAGNAPFFLNLWHYDVHTPIQGKPDLVRKYENKVVKMGLDKVKALEDGKASTCIEDRGWRIVRRLVQSDPVYAAMIENLDWNVGRLLSALRETGRDRDTIVFFTSDNGGLATAEGSPTSNLPLAEGKGWVYEGGTREPLSVRWPGNIKPGTSCSVPVTSTDFYPTILDAAGLPPDPKQHCDGVSMVPLLRGGSKLERDSIFWHYPHYNAGGTPAGAVRSGDFKLIELFEDEKLELYNLRSDPGERHDLAAADPATLNRLHKLLAAWRTQSGAIIPERNPNYEKEVRTAPDRTRA